MDGFHIGNHEEADGCFAYQANAHNPGGRSSSWQLFSLATMLKQGFILASVPS